MLHGVDSLYLELQGVMQTRCMVVSSLVAPMVFFKLKAAVVSARVVYLRLGNSLPHLNPDLVGADQAFVFSSES